MDRSGSGRSRAATDRRNVRDRDRGRLGVLRLLLALALLAALAIGGVLYAPTIASTIDALEDGTPVLDRDSPPPTDDRDPERTHPADPGPTAYETRTAAVSSIQVEDLVHEKVNEERAERDLDPLEWDGTVASVARAHSADMADRDYFSHVNPDGEGPLDRFDEVGSYCRGYGENIATTWVDRDVRRPGDGEVERYRTDEELAAALVEQWMNSPPHREAILTEDWDRGGVGVYVTAEGRVYATHNFCDQW